MRQQRHVLAHSKMTEALVFLVVEDYEPFRQAVCSLLRQRDYRVMEAVDGLEAIEKAIELQPDFLLFDIDLPKVNGIESAKQVLSLVPNVKLIFVTQESSVEVIQETFRLGAQGYIHKQYAWTDLLPAIDAALGGRRFVSSTLDSSVDTDVEREHLNRGRKSGPRLPNETDFEN
jgi:DNA-binding NarL/FixJ family response regulator